MDKRKNSTRFEKLSVCDRTVQRAFRCVGEYIGGWPKISVLIAVVVLAVSLVGFRSFRMHENLKSGYTDDTAPSIQEHKAVQWFFRNRTDNVLPGEPYYMAIFARAKDGGSVMEPSHFNEVKDYYDYVFNQMNITHGNETYKYNQLCGIFCNFNSALWKLMAARKSYNIELQYPVTHVMGLAVNVGRYFFDISKDENGDMTGAGTIAVYFHLFQNSSAYQEVLKKWELAAYRYMKSTNYTYIDLTLHGVNVLNTEVMRGGKTVGPLYVIGLALTLVFVMICMILTAWMHKQLDCSKPLVALLAVVCPILAAVTSIGFILLIGFHVNMLMIISPFLVLAIGIGVDDAFLLVNSWIRLSCFAEMQTRSKAERLGLVLGEVGPSITVTSLTNFFGFALGCVAPVPEIRLFCATVALAMLLDLFYQLMLFTPSLVLLSRCENKVIHRNATPETRRIADILNYILGRYCHFIVSWYSKIVALILIALYLAGAIVGIREMEVGMDGRSLLPPDSQSKTGLDIVIQTMGPTYQGLLLIVKNPPDFTDAAQYREFKKVVEAFETAPRSIGNETTQTWMKDYKRFLNPGPDLFDVMMGVTVPPMVESENETIDFSDFKTFLGTDPYTAWKNGIRYHEINGTVYIDEMLVMTGYCNVTSLGDKARLLEQWRETANRFPQYGLRPWDPDSQISDVILNVQPVTERTILITLVTMAVIFIPFIPNMVTVICATASVASVCAGVVGYLHWWGAVLDPVTMVSVIMTVGLSVDYAAHFGYHYHRTSMLDETPCSSKTQRLFASFQVRCIAFE
uniref:SSD domain-containing protein n=1 Tax=Plectus sambesii TaxID=2011161 RepID=A0A914WXB2_9BILA